jgi:hypothetical protein
MAAVLSSRITLEGANTALLMASPRLRVRPSHLSLTEAEILLRIIENLLNNLGMKSTARKLSK